MKKNLKINTILWLLVSALLALVLLLIFIEMREHPEPVVVPETENRDIVRTERPAEKTIPRQHEPKVRVAIVIDDMGYDYRIFRKFMELGIPLTFSILPGERFSSDIAQKAKLLNYEIMLHLPMEPRNLSRKLNNGTLLTKMSSDEMLRQLSKDIKAVPFVVGVNNHMGSLFTENRAGMTIVLKEMQKEGLFFLDSKTSPGSVAYETAKSIGIRSGRRDVFLDNKSDVRYIKGQIDKVIKIAKKKGEATAIGHPRPETVAALREKIPDFEKEGIELVPVSEVLE